MPQSPRTPASPRALCRRCWRARARPASFLHAADHLALLHFLARRAPPARPARPHAASAGCAPRPGGKSTSSNGVSLSYSSTCKPPPQLRERHAPVLLHGVHLAPASAARTSGRPRAGRACPRRRLPWDTDLRGTRTACTGRRRSTTPTTGSRYRAPVAVKPRLRITLCGMHFVAQQVARAELGAVAALVAGRFADAVHLRLRARARASSGNDRAAARSARRWSW